MSASGRAGSGRGNNRRRPFRRPNKENNSWKPGEAPIRNDNPEKTESSDGRLGRRAHGRNNFSRRGGEAPRGERVPTYERPKWVPPQMNTDPMPVLECHYCGKPIEEIALAIADKDNGLPVHFECVTARIASEEKLENDETITYIGAGRFGIVSFARETSSNTSQGNQTQTASGDSQKKAETSSNEPQSRDFKIKKIIEWENKEKRADWRSEICEHYSIT